MITIIHGDHPTAGYEFLQTKLAEARNLGGDIIEITADKSTAEELTQALESTSLLAEDKTVIIIGLFTMRKKQMQKQFFKLINQPQLDTTIFCLETKNLTKTQLNQITSPKISVRQFKLPVYIWKFLDSISPRSARQTLTLYQKQLGKESPELIAFFLLHRFRQLILASGGQLPTLPAWRKNKLTNQAKKFQMTQLINLHHYLTEQSYLAKTDYATLNLAQSLRKLILSLDPDLPSLVS